MLLHPFGELRRAHQARARREISKVGGGDGKLAAVTGRGQTTQYRSDFDQISDPAFHRVAVHKSAGAQKHHAVTGRIALTQLQKLMVRDFDLSADVDVLASARLIWTVIGDGAVGVRLAVIVGLDV